MRGEAGAEAGLLQREVDELLVREAGAQAAAHFSSKVVRRRCGGKQRAMAHGTMVGSRKSGGGGACEAGPFGSGWG